MTDVCWARNAGSWPNRSTKGYPSAVRNVKNSYVSTKKRERNSSRMFPIRSKSITLNLVQPKIAYMAENGIQKNVSYIK